MSKLTGTILLAVLVTVLLAAGCGPTPTPTLPGESLEWEKIAQAEWAKFDDEYRGEPRIEIITSQQEAAILEGQVYPHILSQVMDVAFSTHLVIVVFQGGPVSPRHSVELRDVRWSDNIIITYTDFLTPPTPSPGEIVGVGQLATSPYYVLRVKKISEVRGDFTFVLVANGEEIMRKRHTIP